MGPNNDQDQEKQTPTTLESEVKVEVESQPEVEPETPEKEPKQPKSKGLVALVIIFAILAVAGIGFGIWAIINANQKSEPVPVAPTDPEPTPEPTDNPDEEVTLEDANIIKDLDQKIAYLHIIKDTGPTFITKYGHDERFLYSQDPLSEDYRQYVTEVSLDGQYRFATDEELASLKNSYPEYDFDEWNNYMRTRVFDADIYANRYIDLFGKEPNYNITVADRCRPLFQYYEAANILFERPEGCGSGTSAVVTYFSKNKYTTAGDNVYVYINAVSVDYDNSDDTIYCAALGSWEDLNQQPCGIDNQEYSDVVSYETYKEYGDRTTYRFVFTKADNGTYYFEKVEKIS